LIIAIFVSTFLKPSREYSQSTITKLPEIVKTTTIFKLGEVPWIKLTILIDNNPNPFNNKLKTAWGLSILIETPSEMILFDAGPNPYVLKYNSRILGKNLSLLNFIVISHEHSDHIGGLKYIAEVNSKIPVYIPGDMYYSSKEWINSLGLNTTDVYVTTKICNGIAIIGEMYGPPYEQALAINVKGLGLVIIVGCCHPGIENIIKKAINELGVKPYAIIGGFHLAGTPSWKLEAIVKNLIDLGIRKVYPLHCSGEGIRELLKLKYTEFYGEVYVGSVIELKGEST